MEMQAVWIWFVQFENYIQKTLKTKNLPVLTQKLSKQRKSITGEQPKE